MMQIVINLPDETYKEIKEENGIYGTDYGLSPRITGKVVGAIQSGTPLSKEIIKASEQKPCGDCISRNEAILEFQRYGVGCFDPDDFSVEQCTRFVINKLNKLDSVCPSEREDE